MRSGRDESRVERIFEHATSLTAGERRAYLEAACGVDAALRAEVESLLAADLEAGSLLAQPALGRPPSAVVGPDGPAVGRRLGAYRLQAKIGEGGMSTVYRAARADDQYRQRVAIKLVPLTLASAEHLRRFRTERHILASLDHPHIARLYDAGTTPEGLPYFVMEYIEGEPIDAYCDRHRLAIRERLELFRSVCGAVHFAHQNLVVHRDLKPSNILVTAKGVPKLVDFGIAKLLNPELTSPTAQPTVTWHRVMTPAYASPEQIQGRTITTASDVYSLGVVLYQLLTGRLPHPTAGRSAQEIERMVATEEPPRPSAALGGPPVAGGPIEDEAAASRARALGPEPLRRRLAGDLDTIVMMALRKEPQRRYGSAEQLSEDLERHLARLPVRARRDTLGYRLGRFLARHRLALSVATLFFATVAGLALVVSIQATQIARERDRARAEAVKSEQVLAALKGVFRLADPGESRGQAITLREALDLGAERAVRELEGQTEAQAGLLAALGQVYFNSGIYSRAEALLRRSLGGWVQVAGEESREVAQALVDLGKVLRERGEHSAAEEHLRRALDLQVNLLGAEHPSLARTLQELALSRHYQGDYDEAESLVLRGLGLDNERAIADRDRFSLLNHLAGLQHRRGHHEASVRRAREALELGQRTLGEADPEVLGSLNALGVYLEAAGDDEGAERIHRRSLALHREILGNDHPDVALSLQNLVAVLIGRGEYEEAERLQTEALALQRRALGDEHGDVARSLNNLGMIAFHAGDYRRAETRHREALTMRRRLLGPDHPVVAVSLNNLAEALARQGQLAPAERLHREALALRLRSLEDGHPYIALSQHNLAAVLQDLGRLDEAEPLYRQALAIQRRASGANELPLARILSGLGTLLVEAGRPEEAEPLQRQAIELLERRRPVHSFPIAVLRSRLGECLARLGRTDEAEPLLRESSAELGARFGAEHRYARDARRRLDALSGTRTPAS